MRMVRRALWEQGGGVPVVRGGRGRGLARLKYRELDVESGFNANTH